MSEIKTSIELPKVKIIPAKVVAALLNTSPPKIHAAILNGTMPVGLAVDGGGEDKNRTIIIESRLIAWLNAEDLKGE